MSAQTQRASRQGRSGPGCFGYGCVIAVVLFTTVIGGVAFYGTRSVRKAVEQYTTVSAPPLTIAAVDSAYVESGRAKLEGLKAAFQNSSSFTGEFSQDELRAIIQSSPWKDRILLSLAGDEFDAAFSFPLKALGEWQAASFLFGDLPERALRGNAKGRCSISEGKVKLTLSQLVLNDRTLEDMARGHAANWIVGAFNAAFNDEALHDSKEGVPESLQKIRKAEIGNNRLLIELR